MKNNMIHKDQDNITDEKLISIAEKLCLESAFLKGTQTTPVYNELIRQNRNVNSYFSYAIDFEGTHPLLMDRYTKEGFSKNSKESQLQLQSVKYKEQQMILEEYFNDCSDLRITENLLYEIHDSLFNSSEDTNRDHLMTFRWPVHTTQAEKVIYAFKVYYFIIVMNYKSKEYRIVANLFLDGILSTIEGYELWIMSRGLYAHSAEHDNYLDIKDDDQDEGNWHIGILSEENSKRYVKFMLEVALEQVNYVKEHLSINKIYKNIQRYIHLSKEGFFDQAPLPEYSELLLKELLLRGEIPRGDADSIINKKTRTGTYLRNDLKNMGLITSDTPKGPIRIRFSMHFTSYLFPDLIR